MRSSSERFLLRQPGRRVLASFTEEELRLGIELSLNGEGWPVRREGQEVEMTVAALLGTLNSAARYWPPGQDAAPEPKPPRRADELTLPCHGCGHGLRLCLSIFDAVACTRCGGLHSIVRAVAGGTWHLHFVPIRQGGHASAEPADPHAVPGVKRGATRTEVKAAYKERMREYHPDKVAHLGAELRALAERKAKAINAAFEALG